MTPGMVCLLDAYQVRGPHSEPLAAARLRSEKSIWKLPFTSSRSSVLTIVPMALPITWASFGPSTQLSPLTSPMLQGSNVHARFDVRMTVLDGAPQLRATSE